MTSAAKMAPNLTNEQHELLGVVLKSERKLFWVIAISFFINALTRGVQYSRQDMRGLCLFSCDK
jgi:hypothetical protein